MGIRAWWLAVIVVGLVNSASQAQTTSEDGFRSLLDGKSLSGWVQVNTAPSTWSMQDGLLVCSGKPIGEIRTEKMYQNFIMEIEWRHMLPKGNAGIFIWADDITARGQPFHRGIEVQVLENAYGDGQGHTTHGDIFPIHGATMVPINGRGGARSGRAFPTDKRSKPSPEWNHYRIDCNDGDISLAVNGQQVTRGKECSPRKGYICLESEGGVVHYRNIRIKELPDTPVAPEHVAISNRGYRSLYTGVDLSGWKLSDSATGAWSPRDWVLKFEGNSATGDRALTTEESFGDVGFIIDFRFAKDSRHLNIALRGSVTAALHIEADSPEIAKLLTARGQWNRLEGTVRGNSLTASLNGQAWITSRPLENLPSQGTLRIEPEGTIDLANIYVRQLAP